MSTITTHGDNTPAGIRRHFLTKSKEECIHEIQRSWESIAELRAERNQLQSEVDMFKGQMFRYSCVDVDIVRCLKTLAYEHNHSEILSYKSLAKKTLKSYEERCRVVGITVAKHDAAVIENAAREILNDDCIVAQKLFDYAANLRKQAKEANDFAESEIKRFQENQRAKEAQS